MSEMTRSEVDAGSIKKEKSENISFTQRISILTVLVSALTTIMSYHDSLIQGKAFSLKNETLITQTKASGLWSFYQAKSGKQNVVEIMQYFSRRKDKKKYQVILERYQNEKRLIKMEAQALEKRSIESNLESQRLMNDHQEGKGILLMQIAISLFSVAALTKKRWLFTFAVSCTSIGILFSAYSWVT